MSMRQIALAVVDAASAASESETAFSAAGLVSVPVILVALAACGILLVIGLDVRRVHRASRLTPTHAVTSGVLALVVVFLAALFASGVAQVPAQSADNKPGAATLDPHYGVQLPTLPRD